MKCFRAMKAGSCATQHIHCQRCVLPISCALLYPFFADLEQALRICASAPVARRHGVLKYFLEQGVCKWAAGCRSRVVFSSMIVRHGYRPICRQMMIYDSSGSEPGLFICHWSFTHSSTLTWKIGSREPLLAMPFPDPCFLKRHLRSAWSSLEPWVVQRFRGRIRKGC